MISCLDDVMSCAGTMVISTSYRYLSSKRQGERFVTLAVSRTCARLSSMCT
ncbi:hypothetical protein [Alphabaculovirus altersperidaniae]|uniref:Uncharacterized protein n=1 Tax=Spodoptera eridania nucleopolyhedrovirus TaxID=2315721 RepID=A0ABX6TQX9_9ABAC|nr:hypothetical protein QKS47_gp010 [Spodoptera eridania nucleopolyhedrovirus]QNV47772.1 hypothetical protein [Spodoptera eridania nucleopolyhedrovirus]